MIPHEIFETLIGSGGYVGAAALIIFIGKQIMDAWLAKRRDDREEQSTDAIEGTTAVGNISTVNAIMTKSIETLAAENARLENRVQRLEGQIGERDQQIETLKSKLLQLSDQAADLAKEVTTYQQLLRHQPPDVD